MRKIILASLALYAMSGAASASEATDAFDAIAGAESKGYADGRDFAGKALDRLLGADDGAQEAAPAADDDGLQDC